jgi:hypothetical protein
MKREAHFTSDEKLAKRQRLELSFWVPERKAMSAKYKCKECSEETYGAFASLSECENAIANLNERMDVLQKATKIPDVIRGLVGAYRNKEWELQGQLPRLDDDNKRLLDAYIINATQYVIVFENGLNILSLCGDATNRQDLQAVTFSETVYGSALSEDGSLIALLFRLKVRIYGSGDIQQVREYEFPPTADKFLRLEKMLFVGRSIIFEFLDPSDPFGTFIHPVMDSTNGNMLTLRKFKENVYLSHVVKGVAYFSRGIYHATWSGSGVHFYTDPLDLKQLPGLDIYDFKVGKYYLYCNQIRRDTLELYRVEAEGAAPQFIDSITLTWRYLPPWFYNMEVSSLGEVYFDDIIISVDNDRMRYQLVPGNRIKISPDGTGMLVTTYNGNFELWTKYT